MLYSAVMFSRKSAKTEKTLMQFCNIRFWVAFENVKASFQLEVEWASNAIAQDENDVCTFSNMITFRPYFHYPL